MAIQKAKTLPNGSAGNYWKITNEAYDKKTMLCTWIISLFSDKAHGDANAPSLGMHKTYNHTTTDAELAGDRTALAYAVIKAKAASMVSVPFAPANTPKVMFDPDLANGVDV